MDDAGPVRVPLVIDGRTEEIPDVLSEREPLFAPELSGARRSAADRLTDQLARMGEREVMIDGRARRIPAIADLDATSLAAWLADGAAAAGEARDAKLRASVSAIDADLPATDAARPPTADQLAALAELDATALAGTSFRWHGVTGVPHRIEGPLYVRRGSDYAAVADDFVRTRWPLLARALRADALDTVEPVASTASHPDMTSAIVFRRHRGGSPVPQNVVRVWVTNDEHMLGAGVVTRVDFAWDPNVVPMPGSGLLTREDALDIAEVELEADPAGRAAADATLKLRCISLPAGRRCGPMWRVFWRSGDPDPLRHPVRRPDAVYLDASTGEVIFVTEETRHYTGSVNVTSNFPYDTSNVYRDFRRAELNQFYMPWVYYSATDDVGAYNWTPPGGTGASIGLLTRNWPALSWRHSSGHQCPPVLERRDTAITLGTTSWIAITPDPTTARLHDFLAYNWGVYIADMLDRDFANQAELPLTLYYDAGQAGGGGQFLGCDSANEMGSIGVAAGLNDDMTGVARDVFGEEFAHAVQWCSETWGAGCGDTAVGVRTAWLPAWRDGAAGAFAVWFAQYDNLWRGVGTWRQRTYNGLAAVGDILVHDEEIDGTATLGTGCSVLSYPCATGEACWPDAHDRGRCMLRASNLAQCQAMFPGNAQFIDWQPYGVAPGEAMVPICVSNDYANGILWYNIAAQLLHTDGYRGGLAAFFGSNQNIEMTRELTATSDNFHEEFGTHAGRYETSDAFHTSATHSFPWLDDTTDQPTHAEAIRMPRTTSFITFTNGGPTGTTLAFQGAFDKESFMLPVVPGESFEVSATTSSTDVDLCVQIYDWLSGGFIASAAGCTDGSSSSSTRNASVSFSPGTSRSRVEVYVYNVLNRAGTYNLRVRSTTGDEADALTVHDAFSAHAVGPGEAVSAVIGSSTDADLFRYDRPLAATGNITFATSGLSPAPVVDVYRTTGTTLPSGSPTWSGTGSVTVGGDPGHYWIRVRYGGQTGAYTFTTTHSGCTACNDNGTFSSPRPLPTVSGGFVWNRLDHGALESGYDSWTACSDGSACDWYEISLAGNERVTATAFDVYDAWCGLELAVYAPSSPENHQYFEGAGGTREPIVFDKNGSMETLGAQLTFVARRAGVYRIRVRGNSAANCPRYRMTVARGPSDPYAPPAIH